MYRIKAAPLRHEIFLIGLLFLVCFLPACGVPPSVTGQQPEPAVTQSPSGTTTENPPPVPTLLPAINEARRLVLEWPATIRTGDADIVRLTLDIDASGNLTPTAEIAGHKTRGQVVEIPNLYETHRVLAEARLDLAGMQVSPGDLVSQPLLPGQPVTFYWSVSPQQENTYRGVVWFYLRFIPIRGGAESQRTISAQTIEIRAVNLLGLSGAPARLLGGVGVLIGSLLSLDNILAWVVRKLRGRGKGIGEGDRG